MDFFNGRCNDLSAALLQRGVICTHKATTMYILSGLTANLQHHVTCKCKVRKYGTLVFRPFTDLTASLQQAMWNLHQIQLHNGSQTKTLPSTEEHTQHDFMPVLDQLNDYVHSLVRVITSKDSVMPLEYDELNLDSILADVHPKLW